MVVVVSVVAFPSFVVAAGRDIVDPVPAGHRSVEPHHPSASWERHQASEAWRDTD